MFALDHTNYARLLPVLIHNMVTLNDKHPDVQVEFKSGNFTVHKTSKKFYAIALDQCYEHNNTEVKGSGGAIELTGHTKLIRTGATEPVRLVRQKPDHFLAKSCR